MFRKVFSGAILGLDGFIISVEADVSNGLPVFDVGFLASEVKEARERVKIALKTVATACHLKGLQLIFPSRY